MLAGNHDLAATGRVDFSTFSSDAGRAIRWTREVLAADAEAWLGRPRADGAARADRPLPRLAARSGVGVRRRCRRRARRAVAARRTSWCWWATRTSRSPTRLVDDRLIGGQAGADATYDLRGGRHTLLNPGSVGQPRDGDARAAWLLLYLDDDGRPERAIFQRVRYDVAAAQRAIEGAGLPQHLADRLSFGM